MPVPVNQRVQRRRETLRAAEIRPVQIWLLDTRRPGFVDECRRQSKTVALADAAGRDLTSFMDAVFADMGSEAEP